MAATRTPTMFLPLLLVVVAFLVPVLLGIARQSAFGYDEAIYAQLSRDWLGGPETIGVGIYRPPGLGVLGLPAARSTDAEWAFRLVGVAGGITLLLAAWWFARCAAGAVAGIVAAVAMAAAWPLQIESTTFLNDAPAAALVVAAAAITWHQRYPTRPSEVDPLRIGVLAAAAFYLRYGSIVALAGVAIAALVVGPRPGRARLAFVGRSAAITSVLLVPHAVHAAIATGVPWGILLVAQRASGDEAGLAALAAYAAWFPAQLMGPLAAVLALVGVVAAVRSIAARSASDSVGQFIGVAVVIQTVVLVTTAHAEPRYGFVPMTLLVVLGSTVVGPWLTRTVQLRPALRGAGVAVAVAALLAGAFMTVTEVDRRVAAWGWTRDVAQAIGADARDASCGILASDAPIMAWYSDCTAVTFGTNPTLDRLDKLTAERRYVVLRSDRHQQPSDDVIDDAIGQRLERWRTFTDGHGAVLATVYRVTS